MKLKLLSKFENYIYYLSILFILSLPFMAEAINLSSQSFLAQNTQSQKFSIQPIYWDHGHGHFGGNEVHVRSAYYPYYYNAYEHDDSEPVATPGEYYSGAWHWVPAYWAFSHLFGWRYVPAHWEHW